MPTTITAATPGDARDRLGDEGYVFVAHLSHTKEVYAARDSGGVLLATLDRGDCDTVAITYCTEDDVWTGFDGRGDFKRTLLARAAENLRVLDSARA